MVKSRPKFGFTLIEIALFLGLSGFLMIGLIVGANSSISRQRYNDSVNSLAEILRTAYNDVLNVANSKVSSGGRSGEAIYGKLITFGESIDSDGRVAIHSYSIVGKALSSSKITGSNTLAALKSVDANIVYAPAGSSNYAFYEETSFTIPWGARLEQGNAIGGDAHNDPLVARYSGNKNGNSFCGLLLIARSPLSGSIHTYSKVYHGGDEARSCSDELNNNASSIYVRGSTVDGASVRAWFTSLLESTTDLSENVSFDICVDSDDNNLGNRRDVRIAAYASNSSAVELVALNDFYGADNPKGSICSGANL